MKNSRWNQNVLYLLNIDGLIENYFLVCIIVRKYCKILKRKLNKWWINNKLMDSYYEICDEDDLKYNYNSRFVVIKKYFVLLIIIIILLLFY